MTLRTQVTIRTLNKGEEVQSWFIFESEHDDLYDFHECMAEDGSVCGERLETRAVDGDHKRRAIIGHSEFIVTKLSLVTALSPPPFELIEAAR